ncbi:Gifsy-1 prophage protein [Erwinia pyrifoliae DSM 12163]|nr:DNA breaking-rejoining protein [Erwinia pyrifoliae]CAY74256.1 Gifsy-1 prophage protein [Erwinia pyrifoliae DSM 12163]
MPLIRQVNPQYFSGENMETINIINLRLFTINSELTLFNCENSITGLIHTARSYMTIVLDGGYVLGQFGCVHAAFDELTGVHIQLHEAEKESGTYEDYKKNRVSIVFH